MRGVVHVLEPAQYQAWLAGRSPEETPAKAGRRLFEQLRCNSCHQGGGLASRGPPLENLFGSTVRLQNGQTVIADETYIRESILLPNAKVVAGFEPIMPSFEGQIGEEDILQLIAEIKSLSPSPAAAQPPPEPTTQSSRSPP
jgi:cytochrome c oxidase subunit 2